MPGDVSNPYASPSVLPAFESRDGEMCNVRREGYFLILEKGSRMPPICLKSGQPAEHWVRCPLTTGFADRQLHSLAESIPGLLLLFQFLNRMEFLEVGLSDWEFRKRRRTQIYGIILAITSALLTVAAIAYALTRAHTETGAIVFTAALCIGPAAGFFGLIMVSNTRLIHVKHVTNTHVWFTGPLRPVLDQFPGNAEEPTRRLAPLRTPLILPDDWPMFEGIGIWRSGIHLVMCKDAIFPAVCLRTGGPAQRTIRVRHSFRGGQQTFSFGLSDSLHAIWRRSHWGLLGGLALCLSGVMLALICSLADGIDPMTFTFTNSILEMGFGAGTWFVMIGMIVALVFWGKTRLVVVKKVERDRVWLIGCSQQVLAMFPELPPEKPAGEIR